MVTEENVMVKDQGLVERKAPLAPSLPVVGLSTIARPDGEGSPDDVKKVSSPCRFAAYYHQLVVILILASRGVKDMNAWIDQLFGSIDAMDSKAFALYLAEDARFKFGNADAVEGRKKIEQAVAGFFGTIGGLHHDVLNVWEHPGVVVTELRVTYTRKDGRKVAVPCVNVFVMDGKKIKDYKIFIDISPVYAA